MSSPVADIAEVLHESISGEHPNSINVYNLLRAVVATQKGTRCRLRHLVRHAAGSKQIVLIIFKLAFLTYESIEILRTSSPRITSIRFQFEAVDSRDILDTGTMIVTLQHTSVSKPTFALLYEPVPAASRAAPIVDVDWSVGKCEMDDRTRILRVIDLVLNMYALMPAALTYSYEGLYDADFTVACQSESVEQQSVDATATLSADSCKRKKPVATTVDTQSDQSDSQASLIGYALHFERVPSFDANFLDYLKAQLGIMWLGTVVLFPRTIALKNGRNVSTFGQLIVTIASSRTRADAATAHAIVGAKRLCRKMAEHTAHD